MTTTLLAAFLKGLKQSYYEIPGPLLFKFLKVGLDLGEKRSKACYFSVSPSVHKLFL